MTDAESLFAEYYDRLLRYLRRAAGEREAARDLTQEVFLRVSRTAIPTAPENVQVGWLFKIARNVALDHHRRQRRRRVVDVKPLPRPPGYPTGSPWPPPHYVGSTAGTIRLAPGEVVAVPLPAVGRPATDDAAAFAARALSFRIRVRHIR